MNVLSSGSLDLKKMFVIIPYITLLDLPSIQRRRNYNRKWISVVPLISNFRLEYEDDYEFEF